MGMPVAVNSDADGLRMDSSELGMGCRGTRGGCCMDWIGVRTQMGVWDGPGMRVRLGWREIKHGVGLGPIAVQWIWDWDRELRRVKLGQDRGCRRESRRDGDRTGFGAGEEGERLGWGHVGEGSGHGWDAACERCSRFAFGCGALGLWVRGAGAPRGRPGRGGGPPPGPSLGGARTERAEGASRAEPAPPAPCRPAPLPRALALAARYTAEAPRRRRRLPLSLPPPLAGSLSVRLSVRPQSGPQHGRSQLQRPPPGAASGVRRGDSGGERGGLVSPPPPPSGPFVPAPPPPPPPLFPPSPAAPQP